MLTAKIYCRPLVAGTWLLFLSVFANGQPARTHAFYFNAALNAKTPRQATVYARKACQLAINERRPEVASNYNYKISTNFYNQSQYLAGIRQVQAGLMLARQQRLTSDTLSFTYYGLLASMYSRLTMNDSAAHWYYQAEQLLRTNPGLVQLIPDQIEAYYYNEGIFYVRLGDQERAAEYIKKSVEMAGKLGDKRSKALSDLQLANYYFSIYQYRQAAIQYRIALDGFTPESVDACWGYALLGNCFRAGGQVAEGLRLLRTSQSKYTLLVTKDRSKQDASFVFESSYYLAKCEQAMNLDEAASGSYQTCIQTYQRLYGNRGELIAASWSGLAGIALKKNQFDKALGLAQKALLAATVQFSEIDPSQNPAPDDLKAGKALYEALRLKGKIRYRLYKSKGNPDQLEQAIQTFRVSLQVAQRLRRSFTQLESTYFFNEKIHPCLEDALEALFECQNQVHSAPPTTAVFELLQSYQAMSLTDALHQKAIKSETVPAQTLQLEQDLRQRLVATETQLINNLSDRDRTSIIDKLGSIRRRIYAFEDQLSDKYPRYHALKYTDDLLSVSELQQKLDNKTAYVSYFTGERFIYGFFATHSRVLIFRRVMTPAFTASVTGLRRALTYNPGMFEYEGQPAANQLFDYLISPIEPHLAPVRRLIIERDGILNNIPFEVLEAAGQPEAYLCKRFALSYSYSAKLTFTSPASITDAPLRPAGFAPYSADSLARGKDHGSYRLLRKSADEVWAAGGTVHINAQATKARFRQAIRQANLLHLATHATANDAQPAASAIGFYPDTPDSLLRASELVNLSLDHVRLVVLSACEGNTGVLRKAEGVLSLARAFRMAGCPTILTTTWSAHDETTAELVRLFYRRLYQGLPVDVALQQARLDYFGSPTYQRWGHPYHWANLTLIGNPDVSFPATGLPMGWLAGLASVLLVGIVLFFVSRRSGTRPSRQPDFPTDLPAVD